MWFLGANKTEDKPRAILDMGSNSIRLLVFAPTKPWPKILLNEKIMASLGSGLQETGSLHPENMQLALQGLRRFSGILAEAGCQNITAFATAAVRDASNGKEFLAEASDVLGGLIETASEDQEANWGRLGVIAGAPNANGLFADMGGGSMQVGQVAGGTTSLPQASVPLGALRLKDLSQDRPHKALKMVEQRLKGFSWLKAGEGQTLYLVGGAWRALAQTHRDLNDYPLPLTHGYNVSVDTMQPWLEELLDLNEQQVEKLPLKKKRRRATLQTAAASLLALIAKSNVSNLQFSAYGIRQGLMFEQVFEHEIWFDAEAIRQASVQSLINWRYRFGASFPTALEAWVPWNSFGPLPDTQSFRLSLCSLADFGWDYHPERRAQDVVFHVLHTHDLPLSHEERLLIALVLNARNGGKPERDFPKPSLKLLSDEQLEACQRLGKCLRFACKFSASLDKVLSSSQLELSSKKLTLKVSARAAVFVTTPVQEAFERLGKTLNAPRLQILPL